MLTERRRVLVRCSRMAIAALLVVTLAPCCAAPALAAVKSSEATDATKAQTVEGTGSLEAAASKAGSTGRAVAMSLIGLGLAVAGIVLAFKRDFKEAAGVFAVGVVAVLLATPSGVDLLRATVSSLFGSS